MTGTTPPITDASSGTSLSTDGRSPGPCPAPPTNAVAIVGCTSVDVLVWNVDEMPPPGTDQNVDEVSVRAAGPALNTAFVVHALGDGPAMCYGAIGDDALGRLVLDECGAHGLPTAGVRQVAGQRTGVSVALESRSRARAFLTDLAAAATFNDTMVPTSFGGCTDVLLGGYFVVPAMRGEPAVRLFRRARQAGCRTWLDCGWDSDSWTTGGVDEVLTLLTDVDIFVPNVDEVAALTGESDPVSGGRALARLVRVGVVVKAGADGAFWITRDNDPVHVTAPTVEVVDTTGAGDALNAGVIVGLRRGWAMGDALKLGVETASAIVARGTGTRWDPLSL